MEAENSIRSQQAHAPTSSSEAIAHPLPQVPYYSVEYPGYVRPTSTSRAIQTLGGQSNLDNAFKRTASKADALVELDLNPLNPFAHPVPGELFGTNNVILKVVRKRRKQKPGEQASLNDAIGEYTAQAVGVVPKTVRFRSGSSCMVPRFGLRSPHRHGGFSIPAQLERPHGSTASCDG